MDFDFGWILLGLPVAFVLGWLASRFDLRQLRLENQRAPKAYFRGLNFLLNEQQDQAIDSFIEAVQKDPDTSELHFALGDLFRRRGEYERAVRVHQHLLARADVGQSDRERAQYALGLDFLKAGLLDHAEEALLALEGTRHEDAARLALLTLYERGRDWEHAADIAQRLHTSGHADFSGRLTHYLCEQAQDALRKDPDSAQAGELLDRAIAQSPDAPRPRIQRAGLLANHGQPRKALDELLEMALRAPKALPLVAGELVRLADDSAHFTRVVAVLETAYERTPSVDLIDALVQARIAAGTPGDAARSDYVRHMSAEPSLIAAARWLSWEHYPDDAARQGVKRSVDHAVQPLARYRCAACGFETQGYFWQCPGCQAWESFPPRRIEEL